jgi:hypothetical protein
MSYAGGFVFIVNAEEQGYLSPLLLRIHVRGVVSHRLTPVPTTPRIGRFTRSQVNLL